MAVFTITLKVAGQQAQRFTFSQDRVAIGRETGDLVVGDPLCSSSHAELLWQGDRLVYRDLGSTNGSFMMGQRIQQVELVEGTAIQIGNSTLQLEPDGGRGRTVVAATVPRRTTPVRTPSVSASAPTEVVGGSRKSRVIYAIAGVVLLLVAAVVALLAVSRKDSSPGTTASKALFGAVTSPSGGEHPATGEATVKAVWFRGQPGVQVEGGTADITVRVAPNTNPGASVGVIEEFAGGTGNQWRTATWLAAFNASRAVGVSLIDNEYLVRAGGHIDGPSAGMLMTATMMALLRGKPLSPATTMTGTINPDGSAGPVGGIVQKMQGARRDGIKRFGYPMGARSHVDLSDNSTVDLEDVGTRLGLQVKELHDSYEAYEFLTGEKLPRPPPIDESAMELDPDTAQRLRAKMTSWKARIDSEVASVKNELRRDPRAGALAKGLIGEVEKAIGQAETMEKSDLPMAALSYYVQAAIALVLTRDTLAFASNLLAGDMQGILSQVDEATSVSGQVKAFGDELLVRSKKKSVGGQVNATLAFTTYATASNFASLAEDRKARAARALDMVRGGKVQMTPDVLKFLSENLIYPVAYYHCARVMLDLARDYQDLTSEEGKESTVNLARLGREAAAYGSAAGASLAYFDALITEQIQQSKGFTKAQAESAMANAELGYLLAKSGVALTESIKPSDDGPQNLLRLAAGVSAYFTSAGLVNKYYALGGRKDDQGNVSLTNRKSLTSQLEQARLHAREAASRARATAGFVPIAARLDYQHAGALREGSDSDKLDALDSYWSSAFWSELAAELARD